MNLDLLNQPWEMHVALASGYSAYLLAFAGTGGSIRTVHIAFATLVFGLIATAVLGLQSELGAIGAGVTAFALTCSAGVVWRRWGRSGIQRLLRWTDVTWSDDDASALTTLTSGTTHYVSQISVKLDDDSWLRCDDTTDFSDAPFGPCLIGSNGDIGLYLTHEERADGSIKRPKHVRDADYGHRITYVPASRIRQMNIRHKKKS